MHKEPGKYEGEKERRMELGEEESWQNDSVQWNPLLFILYVIIINVYIQYLGGGGGAIVFSNNRVHVHN